MSFILINATDKLLANSTDAILYTELNLIIAIIQHFRQQQGAR